VRHEHEWRVWQNAKLPPGKMLMPGVVSHATNLVEHPQLVADRILRYAAIVGRENVIAGTDCGLGGRVHADLAWAKLRTLAEGAPRIDVALASVEHTTDLCNARVLGVSGRRVCCGSLDFATGRSRFTTRALPVLPSSNERDTARRSPRAAHFSLWSRG